jgi:diguanylate cyclase (GGDEF)-like protein
VIGDTVVVIAYFSIPWILYWNRHHVVEPVRPMVLLFAAFILSCGIGHGIRVWNIWHSNYWFEGVWSWVTGFISFYTAIRLTSLIPQFLQTQKDLTKTRRLLEQDALTGIANRRGLEQAVRSLANQAPALSSSGNSLVLIDLDGFKHINDTYGHHTGDIVLKRAARCLVSHIRAIDLAVRLGGDEFAILMIGACPAETSSVTEAVCQSIRNIEIEGLDPQPPGPLVSASVGVAQLDLDSPLEVSYQNADRALYEAKNNGKNQVSLANTV